MSVWEANILASNTEVMIENPSKYMPARTPKAIGIRNVYKPNTRLRALFLRKSFISISRPARNMMYSRPAVPDRMMLLSRITRLKPCGPITAPAIINPSSGGIFNRLSKRGAARMIPKISINFRIGSVSGNVRA